MSVHAALPPSCRTQLHTETASPFMEPLDIKVTCSFVPTNKAAVVVFR